MLLAWSSLLSRSAARQHRHPAGRRAARHRRAHRPQLDGGIARGCSAWRRRSCISPDQRSSPRASSYSWRGDLLAPRLDGRWRREAAGAAASLAAAGQRRRLHRRRRPDRCRTRADLPRGPPRHRSTRRRGAPHGSRLARVRVERWRIRRGGPLPYACAIAVGFLFIVVIGGASDDPAHHVLRPDGPRPCGLRHRRVDLDAAAAATAARGRAATASKDHGAGCGPSTRAGILLKPEDLAAKEIPIVRSRHGHEPRYAGRAPRAVGCHGAAQPERGRAGTRRRRDASWRPRLPGRRAADRACARSPSAWMRSPVRPD